MKRQTSRRDFLKTGAVALGTAAAAGLQGACSTIAVRPKRSPVYFTKDINANGLLKIYSRISQGVTGRVAIKLHTGEPHGPNILPRDMVKALQQHIPNSNLVEMSRAAEKCTGRAVEKWTTSEGW